jgi:fumarate reductase subunit D
MQALSGYKTIIVAVVYVITGVFLSLGWTPSADEATGLNAMIDGIVALITNPIVTGVLFGALRMVTKTPVFKPTPDPVEFPGR